MTTNNARLKKVATFTRIAFWVAAGLAVWIAISLNVQPWIEGFGKMVANNITVVPGLGLLSKLPLIGGWFLLASKSLGQIIGLVAWFWIQVCQVAPMFMATWACPQWLADLRRYRTIAYTLEIAMTAIFFPPFVGGWDWAMLPSLIGDASAIDWPNVALMISTILSFEMTVGFLLKMWRGLSRSV